VTRESMDGRPAATRLDGMLRLTRLTRKLMARFQVHEVRGEPIPQLVLRWSQIRMPELDLAVRTHDPDWAVRFEEEAQRLRDVLGDELLDPMSDAVPNAVIDIQHCGSTAIPPLPSKDIIDIALAVRTMPCTASLVAQLASLGYVDYGASPIHASFSWFWRVERGRAYVVHVGAHDSPWFRDPVNFRDFLRAFPEERARYEALKRDLAAVPGQTWIEYSLAKGVMTLQIIERANAWAAAREQSDAALPPAWRAPGARSRA
jgi:GrpB-like predicted nucleotidyltransferase (UPF0157 family)